MILALRLIPNIAMLSSFRVAKTAQPPLEPKGELLLKPHPHVCLFQIISAVPSFLCLPQISFRLSFLILGFLSPTPLQKGSHNPRSAPSASLWQETSPSAAEGCTSYPWSSSQSHSLPQAIFFPNSSQEVKVSCNQLKWIIPITLF